MSKRILVIILTVCLAVVEMTVMAFADIYGDFVYTYVSDRQVSITGYNGSGGNITIPAQVEDFDFNVVAIGDYVFANTAITSVSIPDTVESIGGSAFALCSDLTSVSLSEGLERIGNNAFENCWQLSSITIPSSVTSIETCAFDGSGITSVTLSCGTTYAIDSFPDNCTITQLAHTYVNGVCPVCGNEDYDYVTVGSAELHDGYYTVDGVSAVYGDPTEDSNITSYAYYDASADTLYLKNFSYTGTGDTSSSNAVIKPNSGSLTVSLSGSSTIDGEECGIRNTSGSINIVSTDSENQGSLTVSSGDYAIDSGSIVIDNASVTAMGRVYATSDFTITDSSVSVDNTNKQTIIAMTGSTIIIEDSYVRALASDTNALVGYSGIEIKGESEVISEGGILATYGNIIITPDTGKTLEFQRGGYTVYITEKYEYSTGAFSKDEYFRVSPHDHSYSAPVWTWSGSSATATVTCACGIEETQAATVTSAYRLGQTIYTATVTIGDTTYTETKTTGTIIIPATSTETVETTEVEIEEPVEPGNSDTADDGVGADIIRPQGLRIFLQFKSIKIFQKALDKLHTVVYNL